MASGLIIIGGIILALLASGVKILKEYERAVIFRLGRVLSEGKGPGLIFVVPFIDKMVRVDNRVITMDVPSQDVITRDNVSVKVNAVIYFRILEPIKSVIAVEDVFYATGQLAQTTLRSVCGQAELDELLSERDHINAKVQQILDRLTDPWGVKVGTVELKHIDLPADMQRAMARQAEAERDRRAKIIAAEGEYQASEKLTEASKVMAQSPIALQLRYLQTLVEIAAEPANTILFPLPIDLLRPFVRSAESHLDETRIADARKAEELASSQDTQEPGGSV